MVLTDLISTKTRFPDLEKDRGNQDKYKIFLLGANPLEDRLRETYDPLQKDLAELMDNRVWTVGILPFNPSGQYLDGWGFIVMYSPLNIMPVRIDFSDPIQFQEVELKDNTVTAIMTLTKDKKKKTITESKVIPSVFQDTIPSFIVDKSYVESYLNSLGAGCIELMRGIRNSVLQFSDYGIMEGLKYVVKQGEQLNFVTIKQPISELREHQIPNDYANFYQFFALKNPGFLKRIKEEFAEYLDECLPYAHYAGSSISPKMKIFGQDELRKQIREHQWIVKSKHSPRMIRLGRDFYTAMAALGSVAIKMTGPRVMKYAAATTEELNKKPNEIANEKTFNIDKIISEIDPPMSEDEVRKVIRFFSSPLRRTYFAGLGAMSVASLLISPIVSAGILAYGLADVGMRMIRKSPEFEYSPGLIGSLREVYQKLRKE